MKTNRRIMMAFCLLLTSTLGLIAQENTHWQCDIYAYEYDMAMYLQVEKNGTLITDYSDYEVAAFVGDECRGVAEFQIVNVSGSSQVQYGYIRIRSNAKEGETVTFKVYRRSTGKTFSISESVAFVNMALEGMPSVPKVLHFIEPVRGDVNVDGKVNSSDVSAIVELIMTNTYNVRADLNNDEKVNAADIVELNNLLKK